MILAEFDKTSSILTVTAIIAVVVTRARRPMVRSVAESTAAEELSLFFSPEIAQQITEADETVVIGQGQVREAAILRGDIRGFTGYANTAAPNVLIGTWTEYQHLLVHLIQDHGGSIDKPMRDGTLATFGAAV